MNRNLRALLAMLEAMAIFEKLLDIFWLYSSTISLYFSLLFSLILGLRLEGSILYMISLYSELISSVWYLV